MTSSLTRSTTGGRSSSPTGRTFARSGPSPVQYVMREPPGLEGDHLTECTIVGGVDGGDPEAGGENTVEGGGRPTALYVTQDRHSGLEARSLLDLFGHQVADAAEAHVTELVELARLRGHG